MLNTTQYAILLQY